jgi:PAS domain S-box-containing protein
MRFRPWLTVAASVFGAALSTLAAAILDWSRARSNADERTRAVSAPGLTGRDLRLTLDSLPVFVHATTPTGEIELVNKCVLDYFGLSVEALEDFNNTTHPEDVERVTGDIKRALRTGMPLETESRGRRADGVYRWFSVRGLPLRNENGEIVRWYNVLTDVDDLKRAQEALRASEQSLRLMVDSIPGLICTNTAQGEVEHVNKTLLDYTGKPLAELLNWTIVVHPEDLPNVAEHWGRSVASGEPFDVEVRVCRGDGVYRWFHCRGLPVRSDDGHILRWYNLLTDIEDRKNAEQMLRARERELALIIDTIPAMVWCAAPDGTLTYANSLTLKYSGSMSQELFADPYRYIHPGDLERVLNTWREALQGQGAYQSRYRMRRADGQYRWVQSIGQLGTDDTGRPTKWYGVLLDEHERLQMEETLRDMSARLARATQVATVGEISASIAHEINQPLAALVTNGHVCHDLLTGEPPNIPRALVSLERIIRDAKSAAEVIQRIRSLYRHTSSIKHLINANDVIAEVGELLASDLRNGSIILRTELEPSLPAVLVDRVQLQQLLVNLTRNAIEAMEGVETPRKELCITSLRGAQEIVVRVRDTGIGMESFEKAFEPFYTTKPNGMGMGLAICRSIVDAHGGRLWAEASAPRGSVFSFALPARD